jgi:multiple sugar transport system substrate-binding protein
MRKAGWWLFGVILVGLVFAMTTSQPGALLAAQAQQLSITFGEPWKELFEPAIADFERRTGVAVQVDLVPAGVDMVEKVGLDLAAGQASDIIMVDSFMIPSWAEAGFLRPLDDFLAGWPDWSQYFPGMQEIVEFQGQHYAVMIDTDVRMLWYWKPIFREAGLPIPWVPKSWADVLETAQRIKEKVGVRHPLFIPMGTKWAEGSTMQGFYMVLLGADTSEGDRNRLRDRAAGKWIGSSPAIERALEFYRTVFEQGLSVVEDHFVPDVWGTWRELMRTGQIGIGLGGSWEWREFWPVAQLPSESERKELLGWAPMPGIGLPGTPEVAEISGGWSLAINADARNPDLAWQFFETLFERDRVGKWLAFAGKVATRADVTEVPEYARNKFLTEVVRTLMPFTTFRDTFPGYPKVSRFVQEATEDVAVNGLTPEEAMTNYRQKLIDEFGTDAVLDK